MKALLLFVVLIISGGVFISATKKDHRSQLSREEVFTNDIVSAVTALQDVKSGVDRNTEFVKLAQSIEVLQQKYPDLMNGNLDYIAANKALDKLGRENSAMHGDTCLRELVHAIFACFRVCTSHQALKTCLTAAYTSYQACKEGGER
jgi:hypothetical protein